MTKKQEYMYKDIKKILQTSLLVQPKNPSESDWTHLFFTNRAKENNFITNNLNEEEKNTVKAILKVLTVYVNNLEITDIFKSRRTYYSNTLYGKTKVLTDEEKKEMDAMFAFVGSLISDKEQSMIKEVVDNILKNTNIVTVSASKYSFQVNLSVKPLSDEQKEQCTTILEKIEDLSNKAPFKLPYKAPASNHSYAPECL